MMFVSPAVAVAPAAPMEQAVGYRGRWEDIEDFVD